MSDFIKTLCAALASAGDSEVILITKTTSSSRRLLKQCSKLQPLLGVRGFTPASLAKELCGVELYGSEGASRLLDDGQIEELLFSVLPEPGTCTDELRRGPHFKDRATASLLKGIITSMQEACVEPEALLALAHSGKVSSAAQNRLEVVAELYQAYEAQKNAVPDQEKWDNQELFRYALKALPTCAALQDLRVVIVEDQPYEPQEEELFEAIRQAIGADKVQKLQPSLKTTEALATQPNISFYRCRSTEVEERFILRDIISRQLPLEECVVLHLGSDYAQGLLAEAQLFGLNLNLSGGVAFTQNKYFHLFKALQQWKQTNFDGEELYKLVANQVLYLEESNQFCKFLHEYKVGWGKERYDTIFALAERELEEAKQWQAANPGVTPDHKRSFLLSIGVCLAKWKLAIKKLITAALQQGTLEEQKTALEALLVGMNKRDAAAFGIIRKALRSLEALYGDETVLTRLMGRLEGVRYLGSTDRPGNLTCSSLKKGLFTGKKYLYLCGLNRFALQGGNSESPLLLDTEKQQLKLKTVETYEQETERLIKLVLQEPYQEIKVSYNYYDTEKMIELQPAPLFSQLSEQKPVTTIDFVQAADQLLVGDHISTGTCPKLNLKPVTPALQNGHAAKTLKAPLDYKAKILHMTYSPSGLETAMGCPFKFFLQKVLGLYPYEVPDSNEDTWLDSRELGTLCHKVLEEYYKANPKPAPITDYDTEVAPEVTRLLEEAIDQLKLTRPLGTPAAMANSRQKAWEWVEKTIKWTALDKNKIKRVLATEQSFGTRFGTPDVKLVIAQNPDGSDFELLVNGSIDRIDERELDGKTIYCVVDYKTSKKYTKATLATKLQPFIYTLVAETLSPTLSITQAGYIFVKGTDNNLEMVVPQDAAYRNSKGATVRELICDILADPQKTLNSKCIRLQLDEHGHIIGRGTDEERKKALETNYCNTCSFKDFCYTELKYLEGIEK